MGLGMGLHHAGGWYRIMESRESFEAVGLGGALEELDRLLFPIFENHLMLTVL